MKISLSLVLRVVAPLSVKDEEPALGNGVAKSSQGIVSWIFSLRKYSDSGEALSLRHNTRGVKRAEFWGIHTAKIKVG